LLNTTKEELIRKPRAQPQTNKI